MPYVCTSGLHCRKSKAINGSYVIRYERGDIHTHIYAQHGNSYNYMDIERRDFGSSQAHVGRVATGPGEGPTSLWDVQMSWCAVMWCDDMGYVFAQLGMHGTCER